MMNIDQRYLIEQVARALYMKSGKVARDAILTTGSRLNVSYGLE